MVTKLGLTKPRYLTECASDVSGITFIRYAQIQNIEKVNNLCIGA